MKLNTVGQLKEILKDIDDDFKIDINIVEVIPEETLKNASYPYPYNYIDGKITYDDVGYSDKVVKFSVWERD